MKRTIPLVTRRLSFIIIFVFLLTGCDYFRNSEIPQLPDVSDISERLIPPTQTPPPTSPPGLLNFVAADYRIDLDRNEGVPGAKLVYLGQSFDSESQLIFNVLVDDAPQVKRVDDSFYWRGVIAPGVQAVYDLRLGRTFSNDIVKAAGTVAITLFNPTPNETQIPGCAAQSLCFDNMTYDVWVKAGERLPSTSLTYVGNEQGSLVFAADDGQRRSYRLNDSLVWRGSLLNDVFINHELRLIAVENDRVHVRGDSDLRLNP